MHLRPPHPSHLPTAHLLPPTLTLPTHAYAITNLIPHHTGGPRLHHHHHLHYGPSSPNYSHLTPFSDYLHLTLCYLHLTLFTILTTFSLPLRKISASSKPTLSQQPAHAHIRKHTRARTHTHLHTHPRHTPPQCHPFPLPRPRDLPCLTKALHHPPHRELLGFPSSSRSFVHIISSFYGVQANSLVSGPPNLNQPTQIFIFHFSNLS